MSTMNFEAIESYIRSIPTVPDSAFTPDVILKWDKTKTLKTEWGGKEVKKSPIFYSPKMGRLEVFETLPRLYRNGYLYDSFEKNFGYYYSTQKTSVVTPSKLLFSYYGKYHKEIDALEIAQIEMEGKRGKEGETRTWRYTNILLDRYFLFRNGEAFRGFTYLPKDGKFYNKSLKHWLQSEIAQNIYNRYFDKQALIFFEIKYREEYSDRETYWMPYKVSQWYGKIAPRPVKIGSPRQNLIKSIDLTDYDSNYLFSQFKGTEYGAICVHYQDGVLVRHYSKSRIDNQYRELYRFFYDEKEEFILRNTLNRWALCSTNNCYACCYLDNIVNLKELKSIKRISQVYNIWISQEFSRNTLFQTLVTLLKYPVIEKVYKAGYPRLAKNISQAPTTNLRSFFNVTPKKNGSIYSNLGMNKVQLNLLEEFERKRQILPRVSFLKQLGGDDIVHWDETKTRKYFTFASLARNSFTGLIFWVNQYNLPVYFGGYDTRNHVITEEALKKLQKVVNLQAKNPTVDVVQLFKDTVFSMCSSVGEVLPNMNPYEARTFRDLNWMHDQYVEIANSKRFNRLTKDERWDKLNKKRIELYERVGDKFKIIVPREPKDIVNEGAKLNHCVGSYLESVAFGYKTILFLRRTFDPDISFYTIEVNDHKVIQIHGNHNKWLGNNPEAIQFVINWLKETKTTCSSNILFNLGQGYCGSQERIDSSNYILNEFVTE